jgi:carbon-monoxide dehydrogenase large subunit
MTRGAGSSGSPKIGDSVPRKEDLRLLTGGGMFSDDFHADGQLYATVLRSPHAHAAIDRIDIESALQSPGVVAVLTGEHVRRDGLRPIPHKPVLSGSLDIELPAENGGPFASDHHVLAIDKVRFVGEPVAFVVADTIENAKVGAEQIKVHFRELPCVTSATRAREPGATVLHEAAGSNIALSAHVGDAGATEQAFRFARRVALTTWVQRVTGVPMEPRSALASHDPQTGVYTLRAGSGNVVRQKRELATVLSVPEEQVRIIACDVGGNFGTRNAFYPEFALLAWAAGLLGKPVKWTCERGEAFASDYGGRDLHVESELALNEEGDFLGLRSTNVSNVGAYTVSFGPLTKSVELMTGIYCIPVASVRAEAVLTNTVPTNSYRSSGRPEAMFVIERLIDIAARRFGFDRVALRRRNLIPEDALPYKNALGLTYDSGGYERVMDQALELAEWSSFEERRNKAARRGRLRGIGLANYIEIAAGVPRERAEIVVRPEGVVEVVIGTLSSGQGHETSFAQLITHWMGVDLDQVQIVTGDTDRVKAGGGSHAGRSMRLAGVVIGKAAETVIERAKRIAAHVLGAEYGAITLSNGRFFAGLENRSLDLFQIAAYAMDDPSTPEDLQGLLAGICDEVSQAAGFPFGSHVCEVEIDPETGQLSIVNYVAVDDVGRAVNPLILHGQAHGAITQGLGQALYERCVYDEGSGQLLTGSFMDYVMPRADSVPRYQTVISEIPAATNPLGIRAGGEGGTTPALAVLVNAAVDALRDFGVEHLEMPLSPERIWRAITAATQV